MIFLSVALVVVGAVMYQKDKQSNASQWVIGAGLLLGGLALAQDNKDLSRKCRRGNQTACLTLEQREEDLRNRRP